MVHYFKPDMKGPSSDPVDLSEGGAVSVKLMKDT